MPIYEYECDAHGGFEREVPMCDAARQATCPSCGGSARRVLSLANVAQLSAGNRKAHAINEKSRHEPRLVTRERRTATEPRPVRAGHGRPWAIGH